MAIMLADFTDGDIDRLVGWIASPEVLRQWAGSAFTHPFTGAAMAAHLYDAERRGDRCIFKALNPETEEPVGHIELGAIDHAERTARVGRVFVVPEHRGRGYGKQMMHAVVEIAFGRLQLHRVELSVFDFNLPAIQCYEQVGFRREGLPREVYGNPGGYWSEIVMRVLAPEWRAGTDFSAASPLVRNNGLQGTPGGP